MKTICPPGYHHNGFVATHALGKCMTTYDHLYIVYSIYMYSIYIYIYICIYIYIYMYSQGTDVLSL